MLEATVNGEHSYAIESSKTQVTINERTHTPDIHQYDERHFHVIHQQSGYAIEVLEADYAKKTFTLKLSHRTVTVQLKDDLDLMVEQLGMSQAVETAVREIKAPMPGLIVGLAVAPGQTVQQGDSVLTLEAMKMENVIKSPVDGKVSAVQVEAGDSVEKNQLLISFE